MRRLASFVAILLLLTAVAPVLACVTGTAMSREESACCRAMHGQCKDMAKMGCCQTEVRTDETPQMVATSPTTDVHWVVVAHVAPELSAVQTVAPAFLQMLEGYFPPGLVTAKITVRQRQPA
jgi:hypothetical protein